MFPMADVAAATGNFDPSNQIGEGGVGQVFKGRLSQIPVAVKKLTPENGVPADQMITEVMALTKYRHPHLIALLGHTALTEPSPCLIFPLMSQGSLRDRLDLKDGTDPLSWDVRMKVAFQAASALAFLHRPFQGAQVLLHLDVKSENILLDQQYDVRVADFGLTKLLPKGNQPLHNQQVGGTLGYLCPEFVHSGIVSDKNDVFAFGVVLAELLSSKPAVLPQTGNLPSPNLHRMLKEKLRTASDLLDPAFLDPHVKSTWPQDVFRSFAQLSRLCLEDDPSLRPNMQVVCETLKKLVSGEHRVCIVCMDNPTNARLQCGHATICTVCAQYLRRRGEGCPVCRAQIATVQRGLFTKTFIP